MRVSYQRGHLRCVKRKDGPPRWEFLWLENDLLGQRIRRNTVIGTLDQVGRPAGRLASRAGPLVRSGSQVGTTGTLGLVERERRRQVAEPVDLPLQRGENLPGRTPHVFRCFCHG